jgi:hypothetical protein
MSSPDHPPEFQLDHSPANDHMELENLDEDHSDKESDSSTLVYDHEAFESFQIKVLDFALTHWNGVNRDDIKVSRMKSGSYNRVIGISIRTVSKKANYMTSILRLPSFNRTIRIMGIPIETDSEQENSMDYILRIPRFEEPRLDQDVTALLYVRQLGNIPVPEVVTFDEISKNNLGGPYMVLERLPGTTLLFTFPDLDQSQKIRVATELGQVFKRMLSKKTTVAGKLILPAGMTGAEQKIDEFPLEPLFQLDSPTTDQLQPNLTTKYLSRMFEEHKVCDLRQGPFDILGSWVQDQFTAMTNELHEDGWFASNVISLCHLDFEPRNILVDATRDAAQPVISGILAWDSAVLAPSFMLCAPPLWIWAWLDDEDEDERIANDVPLTEEGRSLKKAFEEAAGPEFVRYAYPSAYRLARRLVRFVIDGMRSTEHLREAEEMLKEWTELRGDSKVKLDISTYKFKAPVTGAKDAVGPLVDDRGNREGGGLVCLEHPPAEGDHTTWVRMRIWTRMRTWARMRAGRTVTWKMRKMRYWREASESSN